jgi:hypothetical protein
MSEKQCPKCGLWNSATALKCDCGHDFASGEATGLIRRKTTSSLTNWIGLSVLGVVIGLLVLALFGPWLLPWLLQLACTYYPSNGCSYFFP